jgi:hypothetical protein
MLSWMSFVDDDDDCLVVVCYHRPLCPEGSIMS